MTEYGVARFLLLHATTYATTSCWQEHTHLGPFMEAYYAHIHVFAVGSQQCLRLLTVPLLAANVGSYFTLVWTHLCSGSSLTMCLLSYGSVLSLHLALPCSNVSYPLPPFALFPGL
jgi:hypothetical protein